MFCQYNLKKCSKHLKCSESKKGKLTESYTNEEWNIKYPASHALKIWLFQILQFNKKLPAQV